MLIDCPHCAASYHIARSTLGQSGRKMRCATCRQIWLVQAREENDDTLDDRRIKPPQPLEDESSGIEINALASSSKAVAPSYEELYGETPARQTRLARKAWKVPRPSFGLLAVLLTLALGMGAVGKRAAIVRFAPGSAGLFAAIGLPVNLIGLDLAHVTSLFIGEGALRVLAVEGEIKNLSRQPADVPLLQLAVRGRDGREIYGWTTNAPKSRLDAGETMQFRARLAAPPENARDVTVRFVTADKRLKEALR